ncbi:MAG: hypothetical protein K2X03_29005 [Bryobacteraceae bacterium]|nr:hypothetical protein [Bryobacteraceae bacterium]
MKQKIIFGGLLAATFLTSTLSAQCTPGPLSALCGKYTFQIEGIAPYVYGITGVMTASNNGATGVLSITATSLLSDAPPPQRTGFGVNSNEKAVITGFIRLETDAGRYQINAAGTGGTLTFNLSSRPMQYDFWFLDGGRQLYIVSTLSGRAAVGRAAVAPSGCPAGLTNPLQLLNGPSAFLAHSIDPPPSYGIAGLWVASTAPDRAGSTIGVLNLTATSNLNGSITSQEGDIGRHQANADCSGGTLTFNLSSFPVQFDYWYVDGFTKLYFISTNALGILGEATR